MRKPLPRKRSKPRRIRARCPTQRCSKRPYREGRCEDLCKAHLIERLDVAARQAIRDRDDGHCRAAGHEGITCFGPLQWAHIIRRGRLLTRWRVDNALLLCAAHHVFYTYSPEAWILFVDAILGIGVHRALMQDSLGEREIDLVDEWTKAGLNPAGGDDLTGSSSPAQAD